MNSEDLHQHLKQLSAQWQRHVIGQASLHRSLLICLLTNNHILVEGMPGLAKTRAIKVMSDLSGLSFARIQFTPDLLPSDITGGETLDIQSQTAVWHEGPLFHSFVLADEINRAPPKVQAALLEAMEEAQVTVGLKTHPLPFPFCVMATQNPIGQEGTWPLPEAQLDRFLLNEVVDYLPLQQEKAMAHMLKGIADGTESLAEPSSEPAANVEANLESGPSRETTLTPDFLRSCQAEIQQVHISEAVLDYILAIVFATREGEFAAYFDLAASPRATLAFIDAGRALAWLQGQNFVSPTDIQQLAHAVLRHRLILSVEAVSQNYTSQSIIDKILATIHPA